MTNFIDDLLKIYEYEVLKEESNSLILKDMQSGNVFKKSEKELIEGFLEDYKHKLEQSDCNEEIIYYKDVIKELSNMLKIIPNGTRVKLIYNDIEYLIKGNDYETTEEFKDLNYYLGKENECVDNWIMALREEFIIIK
ncbi:hypothetical protein FKF97_10515 [Clostridium perfringens]|nr:hypothetical protein [Clostridium perfringens]